MAELLHAAMSWKAVFSVLIMLGLAPGMVLRTILLIYPKSHPRSAELLGELYHIPRWERPFWVAEQFEVTLCENLLGDRTRNMLRDARLIKLLKSTSDVVTTNAVVVLLGLLMVNVLGAATWLASMIVFMWSVSSVFLAPRLMRRLRARV